MDWWNHDDDHFYDFIYLLALRGYSVASLLRASRSHLTRFACARFTLCARILLDRFAYARFALRAHKNFQKKKCLNRFEMLWNE